MIDIPWKTPSIIVPADAIRVLHAFKQYFNHEPLVHCRDCGYAEPEPPSDRKSRKAYQGGYWCEYWSEGIGAWCPANGFCHAAKRRESPCRNADEKPKAITKKRRDQIAVQAAKVRAKYGRKL